MQERFSQRCQGKSSRRWPTSATAYAGYAPSSQEYIAQRLTLASVRVVGVHVPVAVHARVTSSSDDETLADAAAGDQVVNHVRAALAFAAVLRTDRIAVARWTRCTTHTHTHTHTDISPLPPPPRYHPQGPYRQ